MRITESRLRRIIKEEINNARDNMISESIGNDLSPAVIKNMAVSIREELREGQTDRALKIITDAIYHLANNIEKISEGRRR